MEDQFLTRCRRSQILVTNIGPNDLKIILQIQKTTLFENILSISLDVCLFVCTGASKLAKLLQDQQFFLVIFSIQGVENLSFKVLILVQMSLNFTWVFLRGSNMKIYCQLVWLFVCLSTPELQNWQNYCKVSTISVIFSLHKVYNFRVFSQLTLSKLFETSPGYSYKASL